MAARTEILSVAGRDVTITNPDKIFFPRTGRTKIDLVRYYLTIADGALRGVTGRPMALKRFVNGIDKDAFFQKRAPDTRPEWIETAELRYPSGRTAHEIVVRDAAQLAWVINLGCVDLHPHAVRADDLAHPDELRVDLDPVRGVGWSDVRRVALVVRAALAEYGLVGWPKTSGSRGFHIYCRVLPRWTFDQVRRAAVALARDVERRVPELATSRWWKEERHGVFIDYNQNAKDHTVASAYSVRPVQDAWVSTPLRWEEVADCEPEAFTIDTVPARLAAGGDPWAGIDDAVGSLDPLLELADRHRDAGLDDPPATETSKAGRRRTPTAPLIEIARAANEAEALAGLDRWKARHPRAWSMLSPADVLVDVMRGRSSTWTRIRLNLERVPDAERPPREPLEVDFDPRAPERSRRDDRADGEPNRRGTEPTGRPGGHGL